MSRVLLTLLGREDSRIAEGDQRERSHGGFGFFCGWVYARCGMQLASEQVVA